MLLKSSGCIWYRTAGKKVAVPLHVQASIHSAGFHAGGPHTALEAEQLVVRIEGEAMPAHTVKLATVYANYTTQKNLSDSDSVCVWEEEGNWKLKKKERKVIHQSHLDLKSKLRSKALFSLSSNP